MCILGPVSKDVIYHGHRKVMESIGGVPVYAGLAAAHLGVRLQIITKWAKIDGPQFNSLTEHDTIKLENIGTNHTTSFDLIYDSESGSDRVLRLTSHSDPFQIDDLEYADSELLYLAPLMQTDIGNDLIKAAHQKCRIALDAQGLLRRAKDGVVQISDWPDKRKTLPYVKILKVSHAEAAFLTGAVDSAVAARQLAAWGVSEIVVTRDRWGAHILKDGQHADIPAYKPSKHADATGCGDTFFAAYLAQRLDGKDVDEAGNFAAAAAALKIGRWGPSQADRSEIMAFMKSAQRLPHRPNSL